MCYTQILSPLYQSRINSHALSHFTKFQMPLSLLEFPTSHDGGYYVAGLHNIARSNLLFFLFTLKIKIKFYYKFSFKYNILFFKVASHFACSKTQLTRFLQRKKTIVCLSLKNTAFECIKDWDLKATRWNGPIAIDVLRSWNCKIYRKRK